MSSATGSPSGLPDLSLAENEAIIERGLTSFVEVGLALMRIRDAEQYKVTHGTFETYLQERWQMKRQRAYQFIEAAGTTEALSKTFDTVPASDSVARELKGTPEQKAEAWREAVERYGPNPTAAQTREVTQEKLPPEKRSRPRQRNERGDDLWKDERVLAWAQRAKSARRGTRDRLMGDSKTGRYDWPVPGKHLAQNAADRVLAILGDRERYQRGAPPKQPPKPKATEGGKRARQLHADKRAGKRNAESEVFKMQVALAESIGYLERFDLPDLDWSEDVQEVLNDIVHDLERHRVWNERAWDTVWARMDDVGRQRRLRELKARSEDLTPGAEMEARNARELYERLEKKYRDQRGLGRQGA
jgi:hypothetical protein